MLISRWLPEVVISDGDEIATVPLLAEDGGLCDPEAAGRALVAARELLAAHERGDPPRGWARCDDQVADAWIAAIHSRHWVETL